MWKSVVIYWKLMQLYSTSTNNTDDIHVCTFNVHVDKLNPFEDADASSFRLSLCLKNSNRIDLLLGFVSWPCRNIRE